IKKRPLSHKGALSYYLIEFSVLLVMEKCWQAQQSVQNCEPSNFLTTPTTTPKTTRYKKSVVGTNLLRLSKFGGPSQT
ncbi:hypothetical protein CGJ11_01265, partial [Vibrio parahaemolyticus]